MNILAPCSAWYSHERNKEKICIENEWAEFRFWLLCLLTSGMPTHLLRLSPHPLRSGEKLSSILLSPPAWPLRACACLSSGSYHWGRRPFLAPSAGPLFPKTPPGNNVIQIPASGPSLSCCCSAMGHFWAPDRGQREVSAPFTSPYTTWAVLLKTPPPPCTALGRRQPTLPILCHPQRYHACPLRLAAAEGFNFAQFGSQWHHWALNNLNKSRGLKKKNWWEDKERLQKAPRTVPCTCCR